MQVDNFGAEEFICRPLNSAMHRHVLQGKQEGFNQKRLYRAVAGSECNTVIELKREHHAASPRLL
ncbi:hypothetical protein, partial [Pseudomonas helleri]|uniref:hypothetical protein n=1 Tax=Pseudomonas helleri TaxID=1608996 RepID=UPI001E2E4BCB